MKTQPSTPEEKILFATIEIINQDGISAATNRRIAELAGVNLAAINYYFRSKEALLERVMDITLHNAFDLSDLPAMPGMGAKERCLAILAHILEGGLANPGVTRAHFHSLLVEGQANPQFKQSYRQFFSALLADLRGRNGALPEKELTTAINHILASLFMTLLAPELFGSGLQDEQARQGYLRGLVDKMLGDDQ